VNERRDPAQAWLRDDALPRSITGVGDHEKCAGLIAKSARLRRRTEGGEGRWACGQVRAEGAGGCSEGGPKVGKAPGRRTNVGRKAEPTDQFRPPRCGFVCHEESRFWPVPQSSAPRSSLQVGCDGVPPNTEGGQTADGRWNRPTHFGHLIGDLLDMSTSALMPWPHPLAPIGGGLWPPPYEGTAALEDIRS